MGVDRPQEEPFPHLLRLLNTGPVGKDVSRKGVGEDRQPSARKILLAEERRGTSTPVATGDLPPSEAGIRAGVAFPTLLHFHPLPYSPLLTLLRKQKENHGLHNQQNHPHPVDREGERARPSLLFRPVALQGGFLSARAVGEMAFPPRKKEAAQSSGYPPFIHTAPIRYGITV